MSNDDAAWVREIAAKIIEAGLAGNFDQMRAYMLEAIRRDQGALIPQLGTAWVDCAFDRLGDKGCIAAVGADPGSLWAAKLVEARAMDRAEECELLWRELWMQRTPDIAQALSALLALALTALKVTQEVDARCSVAHLN